MEKKRCSCHNISSLRELRRMRHENEAAKDTAAYRVKSGVAFTLGGLLVTLAQHYAPLKMNRVIGAVLEFLKRS
jgi:hypothetical protein